MITLCIRYTLDPSRLAQFKTKPIVVPNAALVKPHTPAYLPFNQASARAC
jgi:hypothetical protein